MNETKTIDQIIIEISDEHIKNDVQMELVDFIKAVNTKWLQPKQDYTKTRNYETSYQSTKRSIRNVFIKELLKELEKNRRRRQ